MKFPWGKVFIHYKVLGSRETSLRVETMDSVAQSGSGERELSGREDFQESR